MGFFVLSHTPLFFPQSPMGPACYTPGWSTWKHLWLYSSFLLSTQLWLPAPSEESPTHQETDNSFVSAVDAISWWSTHKFARFITYVDSEVPIPSGQLSYQSPITCLIFMVVQLYLICSGNPAILKIFLPYSIIGALTKVSFAFVLSTFVIFGVVCPSVRVPCAIQRQVNSTRPSTWKTQQILSHCPWTIKTQLHVRSLLSWLLLRRT